MVKILKLFLLPITKSKFTTLGHLVILCENNLESKDLKESTFLITFSSYNHAIIWGRYRLPLNFKITAQVFAENGKDNPPKTPDNLPDCQTCILRLNVAIKFNFRDLVNPL